MMHFYKKGISVIELLIVIAILGILVAVAVVQFSKVIEKQKLNNAVADVIASIDKASSQTLASVESSSYGVHFQSDKVIIFKGEVFDINDPNNEEVEIISPVSISSIDLAGGVSQIYFARLSSTPSTSGTLTVSTSSFSKIITISPTGSISTN